MPKANTAVAEPEAPVEDPTPEVAEATEEVNPVVEPDLAQQIVTATDELTALRAKVMGLTVAVDSIPEDQTEARAVLVAELDRVKSLVGRKENALTTLEDRQRYGQFLQPFEAAIASISLSDEAAGVEKIFEGLPIDPEELDRLAKIRFAELDTIEAVKEAIELHLRNESTPVEVWDKISSRRVHFKIEDGKVIGSLARTRAASDGTSTGQGKGGAAVYRVVALPQDYNGPAQVGDTFGPGTDNPVGKAYAERVGGSELAAKVAERAAGGGRMSAVNQLRAVGFLVEQVRDLPSPNGVAADEDIPEDAAE